MHVTFVLVRPQHPGNIGAAARAIANFGYRSLRLVEPRVPVLHEEAVRRAVGGRTILQRARAYPTLVEALRGCHCVIGTSRRRGKRRDLQSLSSIQTIVRSVHPRQRVAILFGSEEQGLHNHELAQCHAVVTIPSVETCPSLNLAHAVAIVAYELRRTGTSTTPTKIQRASRVPSSLASTTEHERMYEHVQSALQQIGFFPHANPALVMRQLRACVARAQLSAHEVRIVRGIARQIMWALRGLQKTC